MKYTIHPEVLPYVATKFKELAIKNPNRDGSVVWKMAMKVVRAHCLASTTLFKQEMLHGRT